jgi:hypothetical protein
MQAPLQTPRPPAADKGPHILHMYYQDSTDSQASPGVPFDGEVAGRASKGIPCGDRADFLLGYANSLE